MREIGRDDVESNQSYSVLLGKSKLLPRGKFDFGSVWSGEVERDRAGWVETGQGRPARRWVRLGKVKVVFVSWYLSERYLDKNHGVLGNV